MKIDINDTIFTNTEDCKEFLVINNIMPSTKQCPACTMASKLIIAKSDGSEKIVYRCVNTCCRKRISIGNSKLKITRVIQIIYLLMIDINYRQLHLLLGFSNTTINYYKKKLREYYKRYMDVHPVSLGGPNCIVEVDETVISRRGIIRNPSSTDDNMRDTVWIIGGIDSSDDKKFFLERVENRQIPTIREVLERNIKVGSTLRTDGYPSYPQAARDIGMIHYVVSHAEGFVTSDGIHTNNIEGFWSHLKSQMRKENGVKRNDIDEWLINYTFKRRFLL